MPQPYDYSTVQVNPDNYFESVRQGRAEQAQQEAATRQTALQKYMPGALQGDAEAQQQAFANATPDQAVQLKQALMKMEDRDLQKNLQQQDKFARLAQWADTPEKWAQATQMAESEGLKGAAAIPFEQRGAKLAGMMSVKEQLEEEWKRRDFELKTRETNASIAAKNAAADASRRRATSPGGVGGVSIDPETGALIASPGLSNMKLTEGQSKDIAFLNRANAANMKLDKDRTAALTSTKDTFARNIPLVGNAMQSSSSRQGMQVGKDFIAAVLRKDTGAAVTDTEFEFYSDIFLPQWGDDAKTLALKEQSRKSFLDGMRSGLSNGAALARMGVVPPPELAGAGGDAPPPAVAAKPTAVPPPPPGFVVSK